MDQQAEPQPPPPQPKLRIGKYELTADQVFACVDPSCHGCRGTGFRQRGRRRTHCVCLLRGMAVRYGDAEDRRRYGVPTPAERVAHEMHKQHAWKANKAHHLGARIEALEAQERELLATLEEDAKHLRARREAIAEALKAQADGVDRMAAVEKSLHERIERTRQELRLLEAQAADAFASRAAGAEQVAEYERALRAIDQQAATAAAPYEPELARVRKDLEKVRRRLGLHVAHHGAVS